MASDLPLDLAAAHAMIIAERAAREAEREARLEAERQLHDARAAAANAQAEASSVEAFIAHLKLQIEKLRRELYGSRSERKARLLDQMELQLEDLEAGATEDEIAAEQAAAGTQTVRSFKRKRPARKPFPAWPVALIGGRQAGRLHAQALGAVHRLPRRRAHMLDEQCGRTGAARVCAWQKVVAVRRLRSRRRPRRRHGDAHHDGKTQRHRPARLAIRRAGAHSRNAEDAVGRLAPLELAAGATASRRLNPHLRRSSRPRPWPDAYPEAGGPASVPVLAIQGRPVFEGDRPNRPSKLRPEPELRRGGLTDVTPILLCRTRIPGPTCSFGSPPWL